MNKNVLNFTQKTFDDNKYMIPSNMNMNDNSVELNICGYSVKIEDGADIIIPYDVIKNFVIEELKKYED